MSGGPSFPSHLPGIPLHSHIWVSQFAFHHLLLCKGCWESNLHICYLWMLSIQIWRLSSLQKECCPSSILLFSPPTHLSQHTPQPPPPWSSFSSSFFFCSLPLNSFFSYASLCRALCSPPWFYCDFVQNHVPTGEQSSTTYGRSFHFFGIWFFVFSLFST